MRILVLAAAVMGLTAVPAAASADTALTCPTPTVTTFHTGPDWFENAEFDGYGRIWIANLTGNRLEAFGPAGDLRATVPLHAPGAIRRGPDGWLYANFGNNAENHGAPSGVVRFHPLHPDPQIYATGDAFGSANGAEFDSAGNLYVADPFTGLIKIQPGGRVDPDWKPALYGADGVATLGGQVLTTLLFDPKSAVVSVPRNNPDTHKTVVELGDNKLPDDMAFGPDHKLYVATYGSGEVFRADLQGRSCVLLSGLDHPTSVRFSHHFGRPGDMYVTQASGSVLRVRF